MADALTVTRVVAIGAHPDDVELWAGGTLARYRQAGSEVWLASVSRGDKGSRLLSREETIRVRRAEAERAAATIGAHYADLEALDSEVFVTHELRRAVVALLRETAPHVVITHAPDDYHPDHRATSALVSDAAYVATSFGYATSRPALPEAPVVYHMETYLGIGFLPELYVDISGVIDVKREMLQQHQSQFDQLQARTAANPLEDMLLLARLRGRQCGVAYAEGFCLHRVYPHVRAQRLLP
ncbi:MAG: PIG-L family deacetylase [Anaerolineae bacterium]|nr:PIG-L family deacetylase [Anaerolineae bacterium]